MPRVQVQGSETFYQDIGKHRPVLLLLHGWGNTWEAWSPLIPALSIKYRLIIPDLPGFGQSAVTQHGWSTTDYVAWLSDFLTAINVSELEAVLGHSYGGKIAAFGWFGTDPSLPLTKKGLFLIGPSGIPTPLSSARKLLSHTLPLIPVTIRRQLFGGARRILYAKLLNERDYVNASPFQEATLRQILPEDIRTYVSSPLDFPLHFCWGEHDTEMPLWMAYEYKEISNSSDVFVVPGAGHFPHHEHAGLVLTWLESWL